MTALRSLRVWLFLLLLTLAGAFVAQRLQQGDAFSTDLLALLPATERDPLAEQAAQQVQTAIGSHTVFLVSHRNREHARTIASEFADQLRQAMVFDRVQFELPADAQQQLVERLLPYRSALLSNADAELIAAGGEALQQRVLQALYSPLSVVVPGADPFGFFANSLQQLGAGAGVAHVDDGLLTVTHDGRFYLLVDAVSSQSVFDDRYQRQAIAAIEQATATAIAAGAEVLGTGTLRFAAQARAEGERDVSVIASISTVGVLLLVLLVFRRGTPLLLMFAVIGASLLGATALALLIYGKLHLLTYVFGTTLIGIAGDYALHYLTLHASSQHWDANAAMRQLFKPLTVAMLTTFMAYLAIALTPFSAFRQIALFCMLGLLCGYLAVLVLLPAVLVAPAKRAPTALAWTGALHERLLAWRSQRRPVYFLLLVLFASALPGWWLLRADDDIHLLQKSDPGLLAEQQRIADILQQNGNSQFFLVRGSNEVEWQAREQALVAALQAAQARGDLIGWRALSDAVPAVNQQQQRIALLESAFADGGNLSIALQALGLTPDDIAALKLQTLSHAVLTIGDYLAMPHNQPQRLQWLPTTDGSVASIVLLDGIRNLDAIRNLNGTYNPSGIENSDDKATPKLDGVSFVDKTASISALFQSFREQATGYVLLAYGVTLLWLLWQCGWHGALVRLLPTALASGLTLALLGYCDQPFNLFTGIALLLVLGIGIDYALFLAEGEGHEPASLLAILLSALTAILGFGLLVGASLPAVSGFGLTVLIGVLLALLLAPLTLVLLNESR
ncbi:MAG: MMPL family transporter [Pseudomonadota bacterium]